MLTESGNQDLRYLTSWSGHGMAWNVLSQMDKIWESELLDALILRFFRATVEAMLLQGSATWFFNKI